MAKTKFFRVAVEGVTADGREITRDHIQQMVDSYSVDTSPATINCEHIKGFSPEPPFNSYGIVTDLKAEEIDLKFNGKTEKRLAMYAQFDINEQAKALNQAGQKLFSSIEIRPNFARTGKAYLDGVAFTDNPASLGIELLKFSKRGEDRKDMLCALDEFTLEFEDQANGDDEVRGAFSAMREFFSSFAKPQTVVTPPAPSLDPEGKKAQPDMAAFAATISEGLDKMAEAFASANAKSEARIAKLTEDVSALSDTLEKTKPETYRQRPTGTGGADRVRAEF